ncbi:hypothetical protein OROMI_015170 [Orobanche minor]
MEAWHASLNRRMLEEIRQKRAAERLNKAATESDLTKSLTTIRGLGNPKVQIDFRMQNDISGLVSQLKEMQQRNATLEEANSKFTSLRKRLEKQLHDMAVVVERLESSRQKLLMEINWNQ